MRIDMDKIFDVLEQPGPAATIELDGKEYQLKQLTVLDVASYEAVQSPAAGETDRQHLDRVLKRYRSMFDGPSLPFLSQPPAEDADEEAALAYRRRVRALSTVIGSLIVEWSGNLQARVRAETTRQIEAARAIG
jgi:hypothetical protein